MLSVDFGCYLNPYTNLLASTSGSIFDAVLHTQTGSGRTLGELQEFHKTWKGFPPKKHAGLLPNSLFSYTEA